MRNSYILLKKFTNMYINLFDEIRNECPLDIRYLHFLTTKYNAISVSITNIKATIYIYNTSITIDFNSNNEVDVGYHLGMHILNFGINSQFVHDLRIMDELQLALTYGKSVNDIDLGWLEYLISNEDICKKKIKDNIIGVTNLYLEGEIVR